MKKTIAIGIALFVIGFTGAALHAHAQTTCLDTGCPDGQICKGSPPTCQANAATCNPACGGTTPICNQNADGTFQCISQAQYGDQTPGAAAAPTSDNTSFVPIAPIPGLTQNIPATQAGITSFLNNLYKFLVGLAAILAVIEIVRGGLEIATRDSVSKQIDGRKHITQAILGLVLVLSPVLVFSIINPAILNLSLSIPALNTQWAAGTPAASTGTQTTAAGCQLTGTYLQTDVCPTTDAATQFAADCKAAGGAGEVTSSTLGDTTVNSTTVGSSGTSQDVTVTAATYTATCVQKPSGPYTFINIAPVILGAAWSNELQPTNLTRSSVLAFQSQCDADGGEICIGNESELPNDGACPSGTSITVTGNVSGKCYQASLVCGSKGPTTLATSAFGSAAECVQDMFK